MRAANRSASPLRAGDLSLCAGNICALRVDQAYARFPLEIRTFSASVHLSEKTHHGRDDEQTKRTGPNEMEIHSYAGGSSRGRRKAIPAMCGPHRGSRGSTSLMVSERDGTIVLDPHVTGACVLSLDEESARTLRDTLMEWLGCAGRSGSRR